MTGAELSIDGRLLDAEGTVLDACRRAEAFVPTFCSDDRTTPGGHCRACLVEVDGRLVAACTTPTRAGMKVATDTQRIRDYRRDLGELMLSEADPRGAARELIDGFGATGARYEPLPRAGIRDATHPYLRIDLDACIKCRACVDACGEIQGQFVFSAAMRGAETTITWGDSEFAATECVSCGACASICPSAAISDVDRERAGSATERTVVTTCGYCGVGCGLEVHATANAIAHIDGARAEPNHGHLCVKGRYAHAFVRHRDRLTTPLVRTAHGFEPISWDAALALVAREFARLRGSLAALSSSRCTNEENYLVQKWFRAGLGTNDVDCCARVCHAPSAAGMRRVLGIGAATNSFVDVDEADLFLVCGSNTTTSHPVVGARVKQAVLRGARLVVVDPRRTELAALADVHLQPLPGTNVPLLNALAAVIVEEGLFDRAFVASRTAGFDEYKRFVRAFTPEATESTTGVPAHRVRAAARLYATARAPMQMHGLGITEHRQGTDAVTLLANLALLVGAIGRAGVGVNPLRGQNNVQGAADMGCQPDFLPGYVALDDAASRARFEGVWGVALPKHPGRTIPRMYDAIDHGEIRSMYILGEDVAETDPDATRVRARLAKLEFLVVQELFLSTTAQLAHLVLPGASFLEKDGTFTNAERRIQRVREVLPPPGDARADWRIVLDLMRATGLPQSFRGPSEVWDEVRALVPAFSAASWSALERGGLQWPVTPEDPAGTPMLHRGTFARGKAEFQRVEFESPRDAATAAAPLLLVTGRVLDQYNAGSMTRRAAHSERDGHDRLEMHPQDAASRGIADGDAVLVKSRFGEAHAIATVTDAVAPGTLFLSFHFPASGTNLVTTDVEDRVTGCPEYKRTPVEVRRDLS